jgi:AsmA protein
MGKFVPDKPIDLALDLQLDTGKHGITGAVDFGGTVEYQLAAQHYRIKPLNFKANLQGKAIPGGATQVKLSAKDLDANLKDQTVHISDLALSALGAEAKGELKAKGILGKNPSLNGKLSLNGKNLAAIAKSLPKDSPLAMLKSLTAETAFDGNANDLSVNPLKLKVTLAGKKIPAGAADLALSTRVKLNYLGQTLALNDLALLAPGLELKGNVMAEQFLDKPRYSGSLAVAPFDLRNLLAQLGQTVPASADPKTLTKAAVNADIAGTGDSLSLKGLNLQLDDSQLKGVLAVTNFTKPAIDFKLALDAIDLDRYLPPKPKEETQPADKQAPPAKTGAKPTTPGVAPGAAAGLPVKMLRGLNIQGSLTVGKLKVAQAQLSNVKLNINAKDGDIRLSPLGAEVYQGKYSGNLGLDARGKQARLSLDESLTGIQVEPLLKDLTGKARLAGTGNFKAKLTAQGATPEAMKRTLTGKGEFAFQDGAIKGVNLGQLVRRAEAGFVAPVDEQVQTDFSDLTGTFSADQGVISNKDLSLKSPLLRVEGSGQASLPDEKIDYVLNTTLTGTAEGQGGKELEQLKGITIPVKVSGSFDSPKFAPDIEGILKARAQKEIDKQKEKVTKKIEEKIKKELGNEVGKEVQEKLKDVLKF